MSWINLVITFLYLILALVVSLAPLGLMPNEKVFLIYGLGFCVYFSLLQSINKSWLAPVLLITSYLGVFYYDAFMLLSFLLVFSLIETSYKSKYSVFIYISLPLLLLSMPLFNFPLELRYLSTILFLYMPAIFRVIGNLRLNKYSKVYLEVFYSLFLLGIVLKGDHSYYIFFDYILVLAGIFLCIGGLNRLSSLCIIMAFIVQTGVLSEIYHYSFLFSVNTSYALPFVALTFSQLSLDVVLNFKTVTSLIMLTTISVNYRQILDDYKENLLTLLSVVPGLFFIAFNFFTYFKAGDYLRINEPIVMLGIPMSMILMGLISSFLLFKNYIPTQVSYNLLEGLEKYLCQDQLPKIKEYRKQNILLYIKTSVNTDFAKQVLSIILFFTLTGGLFWFMQIQ